MANYDRLRKQTDQEVYDMLAREDYYMLMKFKRSPEDKREIRWNVLRSKWSILNQRGRL